MEEEEEEAAEDSVVVCGFRGKWIHSLTAGGGISGGGEGGVVISMEKS